MRLRNFIIKIHIYAGLLTFAQLALYGAAGLIATAHHVQDLKSVQAVRDVPFTVPPSKTDKEVADLAFASLTMPLTRPIPGWAIRRTPDNDLLLDFYNVNGIYRVVVLEREQKLRIDEIRNTTAHFLVIAHAITMSDPEAPRVLRAWAYYNELALWCLLAFCVSGVYLWVSAQARSVWAWIALAAGTAAFVALWTAFR